METIHTEFNCYFSPIYKFIVSSYSLTPNQPHFLGNYVQTVNFRRFSVTTELVQTSGHAGMKDRASLANSAQLFDQPKTTAKPY